METTNKQSLKLYLPLAGLVLIYLITRLTGLTALPMTSYEATWIHWAQIIVQYPHEWLIAGNGGRQPLFTWLTAVTLNIFSDPLVAGRWVSVLAGLASVTGLYFIGRDLFSRTSGFWPASSISWCLMRIFSTGWRFRTVVVGIRHLDVPLDPAYRPGNTATEQGV